MADSLDMVKLACHGLSEKKAEDIEVIDISEVSVMSDYFILASASNQNQMSALVRSVDEEMTKAGYTLKSQEGNQYSSWILLDYTDIIVHLFTREDREFYSLEKLWQDGKKVEIEIA
ncbi:MAG: ribosome silencing factor [Lachnospiraceae bacterium]|jgi:ribosome-associated protein|nr:ribosome silencing factor [Lachnospiraceae bacterium]